MSKYRIMVVDDEESLCEILKFNLEKEGYEVTTVYSAEEVLSMDITAWECSKKMKINESLETD